MSNFIFLKNEFPKLYNTTLQGEQQFSIGLYNPVITTCRTCLELGIKIYFKNEGKYFKGKNLSELLLDSEFIAECNSIDPNTYNYLQGLRKMGNRAVHDGAIFTKDEALGAIKLVHTFLSLITYWYGKEIHPEVSFSESLISLSGNPQASIPTLEDLKNVEIEIENLEQKPATTGKGFVLNLDAKEKETLLIWSEDEDLQEALKLDFDDWKLFLHPKQKEIVNRSYHGPCLVEGGPGTGKSLVALYRALILSQTYYKKSEGKKILIATYSKKLPSFLKPQMEKILKHENVEADIEINSIDKLFVGILKNHNIEFIIDNYVLTKLNNISSSFGYSFNQMLLDVEYSEVILRYNIQNLEDYLDINERIFRTPISKNEIEKLWKVFSKFKIERKNKVNFIELPYLLSRLLDSGKIKPMYDSIIIDEAQDLHPIKAEAISKLVKTTKNNLFFLGDPYQRIFNLDSWDKNENFNFGLRREFLKTNYRTTAKIKEYADGFFSEHNTISEDYKSINALEGGVVEEYKVTTKELNQVVLDKVLELNKTMELSDICVLFKSNSERNSFIKKGQKSFNISNLEDEISTISKNSLGVSTLAGCKGLEFKGVIVVVNSTKNKSNPSPYGEASIKNDESLYFVACTRARDRLIIIKTES